MGASGSCGLPSTAAWRYFVVGSIAGVVPTAPGIHSPSHVDDGAAVALGPEDAIALSGQESVKAFQEMSQAILKVSEAELGLREAFNHVSEDHLAAAGKLEAAQALEEPIRSLEKKRPQRSCQG
eukprot:TRINITY_DN21250_c0_g1_i5.p2 TRINITY_DN21250_c0_g1~~TRINITY_DN21250_c0_g1_i5.p2  ORF type:complete len:124 (+),score=34.27 TRINITY_DN21250_c0_g1_i5:73-444(+)